MDKLDVFLAIVCVIGLFAFAFGLGMMSKGHDTIYACKNFGKYEPEYGQWIECRTVKP